MPGIPRNQVFDESVVGVYHAYTRCVRRAFLFGVDPYTGRDYDHRKSWVFDGLRKLAGVMALDVLDFALLDNHLHLVLRNRPDIVETWSDQEVARRWWELCPERRDEDGSASEPHACEMNHWLHDPEKMAELRRRLSHISWFMRFLCQPLAVRANREDEVTGHFFERRFGCDRLLDESAVLACSLYVDLNWIRAGKADTPEQSEFTSAYQRIQARWARNQQVLRGQTRVDDRELLDAWLAPISLNEGPGGVDSAPTAPDNPVDATATPAASSELPSAGPTSSYCPGRECFRETASIAPARMGNPFPSPRVSEKGFLPMTLDEYLQILDWTGRQLRSDKRGAIPDHLAPILDRLRINPRNWLDTVTDFAKRVHNAVGRRESMREHARRQGRRWLQGVQFCASAFT
jgi:hypothetical protein